MAMFFWKVKVEHYNSRARSTFKDALADEVEYCVLPIAQSKHVHICVVFPERIAQQVGRGIAIFNVQHDGFRVANCLREAPTFRFRQRGELCPAVEKELRIEYNSNRLLLLCTGAYG